MNAVTNPTDFQTRMFERIRDQMGDLLTDAELKAMLEKALEKAFFEPRVRPTSYSGSVNEEPLFVELIRKELQSKVTSALSKWVENHPDEVSKVISETIEKGIFGMMASHFENKTNWQLQEFANALRNKGLI